MNPVAPGKVDTRRFTVRSLRIGGAVFLMLRDPDSKNPGAIEGYEVQGQTLRAYGSRLSRRPDSAKSQRWMTTPLAPCHRRLTIPVPGTCRLSTRNWVPTWAEARHRADSPRLRAVRCRQQTVR